MSADIGGSLTPLALDETGIAWDSDIKDKFGSQDAENFNTQEDAAHRGGSTITGESRDVTGEQIKHLYSHLALTTLPPSWLHTASHMQLLAGNSTMLVRAACAA